MMLMTSTRSKPQLLIIIEITSSSHSINAISLSFSTARDPAKAAMR
jgi:hypothetical protein